MSRSIELLWANRAGGPPWTVGIDEVGRGPWAGPIVACAAALPLRVAGLNDSKKLTAKRRAALDAELRGSALFGIGAAGVREIERLGLAPATRLAMRRALARFPGPIAEAIVDGRETPDLGAPARALIGGDGAIAEIAAASILAKVLRDRLMAKLAARRPHYGWERNAGYGVPMHREGLRRAGVSAHHRANFAPIRALIEENHPTEEGRRPEARENRGQCPQGE